MNKKKQEARQRAKLASYASELHLLKSIPPKKRTAGQDARHDQLELLLKRYSDKTLKAQW